MMKEKLTLLIKGLFSNKEVLKAPSLSLVLVIIVFFINVSLVSVPNFYAIFSNVDQIGNFDGIHEAFEDIYEAELNCIVDDNARLACDEDNNTFPDTVGDYSFLVVNDIDTDTIDETSIIMGEEFFAAFYIDDDGSDYFISGTYDLLTGFDFSEIKTNAFAEANNPSLYYESVTDSFLTNVYYSQLGDQLFAVYTSQFAQMLLYVVIVSIMFMALNFRVEVKKLSYLEALKIVVISILGPAFLTAILGVFFTVWASMLFVFVYAIRIMVIYVRLNKVKKTLE